MSGLGLSLLIFLVVGVIALLTEAAISLRKADRMITAVNAVTPANEPLWFVRCGSHDGTPVTLEVAQAQAKWHRDSGCIPSIVRQVR
jgi:hypothetical protein